MTSATAVEPLLKDITWNQTKPYNNCCPNDYPTGCVATAMGQVMYYYRYPEHGVGSNTYQWNGQQLTANFGTTTYQWSNMQDKLTANSSSAAQDAVATLLYHVGVSVNMNYGPASEGGSGASPSYIAPALINHFGYDKGCHLRSREYFTKTEWEATVRNELDNGRPILYGGFTMSASGHSFVCDGYNQQGYYHINWGWDGLNNGYFLLSALDPKTKGTGGGEEGQGFNYNQTMVIGIQKPVDGSKQAYSFVFKYIDQATVTVNRNQPATLKAYGVHTNGTYTLTIPEEFIGNEAYIGSQPDKGAGLGGKYNPAFTLTYTVDSTVGIDTLTIDNAAGKTVYSIDGRKVSGKLQRGTYIIDGQKRFVK